MRSSLAFFALIVVLIVAVNCTNALKSAKNQTPPPVKTCEKPVVCNCYPTVNHDLHVSDAIKKLETKFEKLIAQNLEMKLEKLIAQNLETKLEKLIALVNKTSTPASPAVPASSCKELYEKHKLTTSQVYMLKFGSQKIPVYCHMGNFGCGDGGWTLAMKIDGTKRNFHYGSHYWSDRNSYNVAAGQTDFDTQETKLPTYWNTPFSKICLGMRIGNQKKFVVTHKHANSLYSLIADGKYRATSLGRNTWKYLIGSQASLQTYCNKEGFNAMGSDKSGSKARIGILSNDQNDCSSCDSRIGFGTGGYNDDSNTCGNEATHSLDNGDKHIKTMGYILVQ